VSDTELLHLQTLILSNISSGIPREMYKGHNRSKPHTMQVMHANSD